MTARTNHIKKTIPVELYKGLRYFIRIWLLSLPCILLSFSVLSQTATSTTVSLNPSPSCLNSNVTITATVVPAAATGTVDFFNGPTNIGTATLSGGTASITLSSLPSGTLSIYANYLGQPLVYLGSSSPAVTHIVNTSPTISSQPANVTTAVGCNISFSVTAGGTGPFTYQWHLNGNPVAGATAATYSINPVSAGQAGNYTVVVSNACGTVTSNPAVLSVNAPLNAGAHNTSAVTACINYNPDLLSFTTLPTGGLAPYTYQWQLNGAPIGGATAASYDPPNLVTAGNYVYNVLVTDACNTVVSTATKTITIVADPVLSIAGGSSVSACLGANVVFTASITGGTGDNETL